ncbi:glutathione-specific gamma-glutamylcyclotransferase 1 isoform X2 [Ptiloglossa arizonensis]|uniref:glutathione-specific gamma-glutamylcyclotransferase 1 isoform X2 n=1 Tax=Ptiloglossa arizonensis TaxID=3350558 RepID=UPI003F9FF20A
MEDIINNGNNELWVFGYGSLCWHPGFKYKRSMIGYVKGFSRRFWQGNTTHRGTVEKPGRVVTLIEDKEQWNRYWVRGIKAVPRYFGSGGNDKIWMLCIVVLHNFYANGKGYCKSHVEDVNEIVRGSPPLTNNHWHVARVIILFHAETKRKLSGIVYGRAFQVHDSTALSYLKNRECILGGYITTLSTFCTQAGNEDISTIIFIATSKNEQWLGEAPLHTIAAQIYECSGPSGHNVEYLLRLADFMHRYLPEAHDEHLFTLELLVRSRIKEENTCLRLLMGDRNFNIDLDDDDEIDVSDEDDSDDWDDNEGANNIRENTFQFSLRIPNKTLRCLKM